MEKVRKNRLLGVTHGCTVTFSIRPVVSFVEDGMACLPTPIYIASNARPLDKKPDKDAHLAKRDRRLSDFQGHLRATPLIINVLKVSERSDIHAG